MNQHFGILMMIYRKVIATIAAGQLQDFPESHHSELREIKMI